MSSLPETRHWLPVIPVLLILLLAAALTGCSRDMHDLQSYIQKVKQRPGGPIAPLPEMQPFATYNYPDTTVRDPFSPLTFGEPARASSLAQSGPRPDPTRPKEALEEYPLDSLAFVGTLQRKHQVWALIRDPDGTIHRVQIGNYMGRHYGRIVTISSQSIKVTELIPNQQGGWVQHQVSLAMND